MKRKISFLLALTMVLTFIPFSSFAAQNYDKQLKEAIVKSKELFNIGDEYDKFNHNINSYDGKTVFYLNWSDSKGKLGNIDVSMTVDGIVTSYGKWKPTYEEQKPKLPKISREEGLKIAKNFIKKVSPEFVDKIKYIDTSEPLNVHSGSYGYYFVRVENEIPYYNDSIDIYMDNSTGEVINYYSNWDMDLVFPDAKDIISSEKAQELYKEKIGLSLLYKSNYTREKPKVYLAYGPLNTNLGINAKDGEVVNLNDYLRFYDKNMNMGGRGEAVEEELSPDEKKAVEDITGLISQKDAEKIGREILGLDSKYELGYISLNKNWRDDSYYWQMDFNKGSDTKAYYANISIDAKTKELISFYKNISMDPNKKVQYNEEQALDIAKEYIKKTNPDKFELIELNKNPVDVRPLEDQRNYNFEFIRKVDNAYVQQDSISILVDAIEGQIIEYRINWSKGDFPPKDNIIPINKAYNILFNDIGMELKYITPHRYSESSKDNKKVILAYGLKSEKPANIDANTGTILNNQGEPFKISTVKTYSDIDKSYAKDKINILAQYGIVLPGEKFNPKEKINQRDFLYLLAKAKAPYFEMDNENDALYTYVVRAGIIKEDERAPEKIVTKEEGIKYIIRALKYDEIADLNEIYKDLFKDTKDIDPKLKGYVSIAYGLRIVEGAGGKLNPKAELKR
ncbi:MAG: hypothetical protein GX987_00450, partial [Tissierellia bacterium]|nr:hypothetical protein [Tissierellia bacterium]